jgi:hypothetical protein
MSTKGWRLFEDEFKERAPARYWVTRTFRRRFIYPLTWKYDAISQWIRYRTINRYHIIKTGLQPGYYEIDEQMLHSNFNMLKTHVECDLASRTYWMSYEHMAKASWFEKHMPFYYAIFPFCRPEMGLKHLDWAATLDDPLIPLYEQSPLQAAAARETKLLYLWWVVDRPARAQGSYPGYSMQGLGKLGMLDDDFDDTAEDYKAYKTSIDAITAQETKWEDEDTDYLVRLVKLRKTLWV